MVSPNSREIIYSAISARDGSGRIEMDLPPFFSIRVFRSRHSESIRTASCTLRITETARYTGLHLLLDKLRLSTLRASVRALFPVHLQASSVLVSRRLLASCQHPRSRCRKR